MGSVNLWSCRNAGSLSAPLRGSTAAAAWPRIGSASTERPWRSCVSPQSASCSENSAIRPEVSGQTLRATSPNLADRHAGAEGRKKLPSRTRRSPDPDRRQRVPGQSGNRVAWISTDASKFGPPGTCHARASVPLTAGPWVTCERRRESEWGSPQPCRFPTSGFPYHRLRQDRRAKQDGVLGRFRRPYGCKTVG